MTTFARIFVSPRHAAGKRKAAARSFVGCVYCVLPGGFPERDQLRTVVTLRFTQFHLHQTLRLSLFAFWGVSEDDGYIITSVRYAFSDALWGEVGANLFVGDRNGQFGSLGDNDNIYATLRYAF